MYTVHLNGKDEKRPLSQDPPERSSVIRPYEVKYVSKNFRRIFTEFYLYLYNTRTDISLMGRFTVYVLNQSYVNQRCLPVTLDQIRLVFLLLLFFVLVCCFLLNNLLMTLESDLGFSTC